MRTPQKFISLMPSDLPHQCPHCGSSFRLRQNVRVIPGRVRRALEVLANIALWAGVISFAVIMLGMYFAASGSFNQHRGLGFGMMAIMLGPHLAAEMLISLAKNTRLVTCHECGFSQTHPFPRSSSLKGTSRPTNLTKRSLASNTTII